MSASSCVRLGGPRPRFGFRVGPEGRRPRRATAKDRCLPVELLRIASLQCHRVSCFHTKAPFAFLPQNFELSNEPQVMAKQALLADNHLFHYSLERRMTCYLNSYLNHPVSIATDRVQNHCIPYRRSELQDFVDF